MERLIIYRCPITSLEVQTLLQPSDQSREGKKHYESLTCPSCTRLHFVNRKTGKLLGYENESEERTKAQPQGCDGGKSDRTEASMPASPAGHASCAQSERGFTPA